MSSPIFAATTPAGPVHGGLRNALYDAGIMIAR